MKEFKEMTKDELIKVIEDQQQLILDLQVQLENARKKTGRKEEVLQILKDNSPITIVSISEKLGISTKNVSSQLTYLRQNGYNICTDVNGKKFLVEPK